jgi:HAD superfamily hydrolase (TIGR01490 family)
MDKQTRIVAIFDFDGTITTKSTTALFLSCVLGWKYIFYMIFSVPMILLYKMHLINLDQLNNYIVKHCLKGCSLEILLEKGRQFSHTIIPKLLRKDAVQKIKYHQALGHYCILATAAYDVYIEYWAKLNHFDAVVCTRLEFDKNNYATGKLAGLTCNSNEKMTRIKAIIGEEKNIIYAYGDSQGDQAMLALADYPYYRSFTNMSFKKNNNLSA